MIVVPALARVKKDFALVAIIVGLCWVFPEATYLVAIQLSDDVSDSNLQVLQRYWTAFPLLLVGLGGSPCNRYVQIPFLADFDPSTAFKEIAS
jgi:hypothetical protein